MVTCAVREIYVYMCVYRMNNNSWLFKTGWKVVGVYFLKNEFCRNGTGFSVVKFGEELKACFGWIEEKKGRFILNVAVDCFSGRTYQFLSINIFCIFQDIVAIKSTKNLRRGIYLNLDKEEIVLQNF